MGEAQDEAKLIRLSRAPAISCTAGVMTNQCGSVRPYVKWYLLPGGFRGTKIPPLPPDSGGGIKPIATEPQRISNLTTGRQATPEELGEPARPTFPIESNETVRM